MDCRLPGSSVYEILQATVMEWIAMPSSRGYPQPRDWTCFSYISCIDRRVLYHQHHQETLWMGIWLCVRGQLKVIWQYCSPEAERGWDTNSFHLKEGSGQCSTKFTKVYFFASWYLYKFWEWLIKDGGCLLILVETEKDDSWDKWQSSGWQLLSGLQPTS